MNIELEDDHGNKMTLRVPKNVFLMKKGGTSLDRVTTYTYLSEKDDNSFEWRNLIKSNDKTDILVVNNNSSDGTKEYLNSLTDNNIKFYIYNLDTNLNGAGGFNYGIKKAYETGRGSITIRSKATIEENNDDFDVQDFEIKE